MIRATSKRCIYVKVTISCSAQDFPSKQDKVHIVINHQHVIATIIQLMNFILESSLRKFKLKRTRFDKFFCQLASVLDTNALNQSGSFSSYIPRMSDGIRFGFKWLNSSLTRCPFTSLLRLINHFK